MDIYILGRVAAEFLHLWKCIKRHTITLTYSYTDTLEQLPSWFGGIKKNTYFYCTHLLFSLILKRRWCYTFYRKFDAKSYSQMSKHISTLVKMFLWITCLLYQHLSAWRGFWATTSFYSEVVITSQCVKYQREEAWSKEVFFPNK